MKRREFQSDHVAMTKQIGEKSGQVSQARCAASEDEWKTHLRFYSTDQINCMSMHIIKILDVQTLSRLHAQYVSCCKSCVSTTR